MIRATGHSGEPMVQALLDDAGVALGNLFERLPNLIGRTTKGSQDEVLAAWSSVRTLDPTNLHASLQMAGDRLQHAVTLKDAKDPRHRQVALKALAELEALAASCDAFERTDEEPPSSPQQLAQLLTQRRPNLPLSAFGPGAMTRLRAQLELNLGLAVEIAGVVKAAAGRAGPSCAADVCHEACRHYARSAELDASKCRIFQLWAEAQARAPPQPRAWSPSASPAQPWLDFLSADRRSALGVHSCATPAFRPTRRDVQQLELSIARRWQRASTCGLISGQLRCVALRATPCSDLASL